MTVQFNPSISGLQGAGGVGNSFRPNEATQPTGDFSQAIQKSLASVNQE